MWRRWFQETGVKEQGEWDKRSGKVDTSVWYPSLCWRHRDSVWLGLLESVNFFQNFPSEGSEDEAWLPHVFMADVSLGSTNIAHLRAVFIHKPSCSRARERPRAEGRILLYLLEMGPCQQEMSLNSQQMKQRWAKEMGMGLQGICCIKQTYVKARYGTWFASIWPLVCWLRNSQTEFTASFNWLRDSRDKV